MLNRLHGSTEIKYNKGAETTLAGVEQCSVLKCESPLPAGVVSANAPPSREGVSVSENVWFKHWAKKSLSSDDLASLTDHEERVWWRFLAVASSQDERWTVRLSLKLTIEAMARSCASTPPKLRASLARFEAMGMLTAVGGGWLVTNREKYQETPEAKRKREQRERDKHRDLDRDMSQDSHAPSHGSLLREEDRGQRTDLSVAKATSREGADAPLPKPRKTDLTVGFRDRMESTYGPQLADFGETWDFHTDSDYLSKKADKQAYVEGRLKAAVKREIEWRKGQTNGRMGTGANTHSRGSSPQDDPELKRLRALGIIAE